MERNIHPAALTTLLGTATVQLGTVTNNAGITLIVSRALVTEALADRGIDFQSLLGRSRFPHVRLALTKELLENFSMYGIYGKEDTYSTGKGKGTVSTYYLELLDNGRLIVRYQQILGSWRIGDLEAIQVAVLKEIIGSAVSGLLRCEQNALKNAA